MKMKITQKVIAETAGVSYATVSRAFSKKSAISTEAEQKIKAAMQKLGLTDQISPTTFDLCIPKGQVMVIAGDVANDFYSEIIKGICDKLQDIGMIVTLCNSGYVAEVENQYIQYAQLNGFAGVILVTAVETPTLVQLLKAATVPVVLVNRYIRSLDLDVVCIDNFRGGYMASNYLIEHGHKRIALLLGPQDSTANQDRLRGVLAAIEDAHLSIPEKNIFRGDQTRESGRSFANSIAASQIPYTALFISNNPMAVGAANRLRELGYHIPNDISIICFDNSPLVEDGGLSLTTVGYDPYPMGIAAAEALAKRIKAPEGSKTQLYFLPHIICRSSVKGI